MTVAVFRAGIAGTALSRRLASSLDALKSFNPSVDEDVAVGWIARRNASFLRNKYDAAPGSRREQPWATIRRRTRGPCGPMLDTMVRQGFEMLTNPGGDRGRPPPTRNGGDMILHQALVTGPPTEAVPMGLGGFAEPAELIKSLTTTAHAASLQVRSKQRADDVFKDNWRTFVVSTERRGVLTGHVIRAEQTIATRLPEPLASGSR